MQLKQLFQQKFVKRLLNKLTLVKSLLTTYHQKQEAKKIAFKAIIFLLSTGIVAIILKPIALYNRPLGNQRMTLNHDEKVGLFQVRNNAFDSYLRNSSPFYSKTTWTNRISPRIEPLALHLYLNSILSKEMSFAEYYHQVFLQQLSLKSTEANIPLDVLLPSLIMSSENLVNGPFDAVEEIVRIWGGKAFGNTRLNPVFKKVVGFYRSTFGGGMSPYYEGVRADSYPTTGIMDLENLIIARGIFSSDESKAMFDKETVVLSKKLIEKYEGFKKQLDQVYKKTDSLIIAVKNKPVIQKLKQEDFEVYEKIGLGNRPDNWQAFNYTHTWAILSALRAEINDRETQSKAMETVRNDYANNIPMLFKQQIFYYKFRRLLNNELEGQKTLALLEEVEQELKLLNKKIDEVMSADLALYKHLGPLEHDLDYQLSSMVAVTNYYLNEAALHTSLPQDLEMVDQKKYALFLISSIREITNINIIAYPPHAPTRATMLYNNEIVLRRIDSFADYLLQEKLIEEKPEEDFLSFLETSMKLVELSNDPSIYKNDKERPASVSKKRNPQKEAAAILLVEYFYIYHYSSFIRTLWLLEPLLLD